MNNVKVGQFIKEHLKSKGITQEQLADKLNISSSAVSQSLSGKNSFDISNLMEISKILDIDLDIIVNAGQERETNLERLSKMTVDQYMVEDPGLKAIREEDSKGNKLIDYLIKHENVKVLKMLMEKGIHHQGKGNVLYLTLLLKYYKQLGIPVSYFNRENGLPNFATMDKKILSKIDRKPYATRNKITEFDLLGNEEQQFVKTLLEVKDFELLEKLPYFENGIQDKIIPELLYYAIQFDEIKVVEYEEKVHEPYDHQLRQLQHRKYEELFQYAILHQSKQSIKFYYDKLDRLKYESIFKLLTDSGDIQFSKWFIETFPEKDPDRFHHQQSKGIDNSSSLIDLSKNNDMNLFMFSMLFSNQEALNKTLAEIPQDKIEFIVALVKGGANYTYRDGYSGKPVELVQVSETMRHILKNFEKK